MSVKDDFETFFNETLTEAHILKFEYTNNTHFSTVIRSKIDPEADAKYYSSYFAEWVRKFGAFTKTHWVCRNKPPKEIRRSYRELFACRPPAVLKKKLRKFGACNAIIELKVKRNNTNCLKVDPFIRRQLHLITTIDFVHTHPLPYILKNRRKMYRTYNEKHISSDSETSESTSDPLEHKNISDTDEIFIEYLKSGHYVSVAKAYHKLVLVEKFGLKYAGNGITVDSMFAHLNILLNKHNLPKRSAQQHVALSRAHVEANGGKLIQIDNTIIVETPIMKQVFLLTDSQVLFIDSIKLQRFTVTFFYLGTQVGLMPIVCALHNTQTGNDFYKIFETAKLALNDNEYAKKMEPKIIFTNDSSHQRLALSVVYTSAKLKIMPTDLCRAFWKFQAEDKRIIMKNKSHHKMMVAFRQMIHRHEFNINLMAEDNVNEYCEKTFARKEDWIEEEGHFNSVIELSLLINREFFQQKCEVFETYHMLEVLNILDRHNIKLMEHSTKGSLTVGFRTKFITSNLDASNFETEDGVEFTVPTKSTTEKRFYTLRLDTYVCSCPSGYKGQFCEHLVTAVNKFESGVDHVTVRNNLEDAPSIKQETVLSDNEMDECEEFPIEVNANEDSHDPLVNEGTVDREKGFEEEYNVALKELNDEFQRLNKLFEDNPTKNNISSMKRLATELSKIRPIERVNFNGIKVETNKENMSSSSESTESQPNEENESSLRKRIRAQFREFSP